MRSIPFLNGRYPVRTVYTEKGDWQEPSVWPDRTAREALLRAHLGVPLRRVVYARETHSANIRIVSGGQGAGGSVPRGGYDALVTDAPGVLLCILTADCLPLFLYDPVKHTAAIAHCGWRGIAGGIASGTVRELAGRFGTDPADLVAAVGPAICGNCYEVGGELIGAFSRRFSPETVGELFRPRKDGKYLLDLRKAVAAELLGAGLRPEQIFDTGICTYETESLASARRDGRPEPSEEILSGIVLL